MITTIAKSKQQQQKKTATTMKASENISKNDNQKEKDNNKINKSLHNEPQRTFTMTYKGSYMGSTYENGDIVTVKVT